MPEGKMLLLREGEQGWDHKSSFALPIDRPPSAPLVSRESGVNKPPAPTIQWSSSSLARPHHSMTFVAAFLLRRAGGPEKGEDGNGRMRPDVGLLPEMRR